MRTIVLGPPGTGKTTTLLNKVDEYLKQTDPDKIGYFAFTRKAAEEARKRINVSEKEVPYFQTLHAFCYHLLGLKEEDIIQPYHYEDLGKKLKMQMKLLVFDTKITKDTFFITGRTIKYYCKIFYEGILFM